MLPSPIGIVVLFAVGREEFAVGMIDIMLPSPIVVLPGGRAKGHL
jgi:hypothetical protein